MTSLANKASLSKVSLSETLNDFTAMIALPNLSERDIEIRISKDLLSVWSRKPFVGFLRSIPFPALTLPEYAKATITKSRLVVRVPKAFQQAG